MMEDEFEKYFKSADLDQNGKISISESKYFFQKFDLPNTQLAKIWKYLDQEEIGSLDRSKFYDALKLVTLSQRGFNITPETIISELYGPNGSKIPAPIIPSPSSQIGPTNVNEDWPRLSEKDIEIYTDIFKKIDKDNDGIITCEQADTCFTSWKLPKEVINQVIGLADPENYGNLYLKEFCIAVYLLARYREGYIIPNSLPNSLLFDERLNRINVPFFNPKFRSNSGLSDSAHEHTLSRQTTFPFQVNDNKIEWNNMGTRGLGQYGSSSSTYNFNPSYDNYQPRPHETLIPSPINYQTVPIPLVVPLLMGKIRYPSIDLTHVEFSTLDSKIEPDKETISKETGTGTGTEVSVGTGTGTGTGEEDNKECVVCCEKPKNCACLPCGHVATCYECLELIKKSKGVCLICRGEIAQVVKIYNA